MKFLVIASNREEVYFLLTIFLCLFFEQKIICRRKILENINYNFLNFLKKEILS